MKIYLGSLKNLITFMGFIFTKVALLLVFENFAYCFGCARNYVSFFFFFFFFFYFIWGGGGDGEWGVHQSMYSFWSRCNAGAEPTNSKKFK